MILNKVKIFTLRAEKNLKVKDLANKCEISPQALSNALKKGAGAITAGKIAKALGVSVEEILADEEVTICNKQKP